MSVTLKSRLPQLKAEFRNAASRLVHETAEEIKETTQALAPGSTGALRDSYHTARVDDLNAIVGTALDYSLHVEYGTSYSAAQPHLFPAFEIARQRYFDAIRRLLRGNL